MDLESIIKREGIKGNMNGGAGNDIHKRVKKMPPQFVKKQEVV
jgi:hypothetical protein